MVMAEFRILSSTRTILASLFISCCIIVRPIEGNYSQSTLNVTDALFSTEGRPSSTCGRTTFWEQSGYVASAGFAGGRYPTGVNCTYDIKVKAGSRIQLNWHVFDVDGSMPDCNGNDEDYTEIYVGCQYAYKTRIFLTRFCNRDAVKTIPHDIYTEDNCLRIRFISSSLTPWKYNKGFLAAYTTMGVLPGTCGSSRPKELTETSGVIYSPSWPFTYSTMMKGSCEWNIKANDVDVIKLNVMSLDVFGQKYYCQNYYYSSDTIDIKGKKSDYASKFERVLCGNYRPFSITTQFSELDILFQKNKRTEFSKKGFIIGYIVYTPGRNEIFPLWKIFMIAVVAILSTSCMCYCLLAFKKRERARMCRRRQWNTNDRGWGALQNTEDDEGERPQNINDVGEGRPRDSQLNDNNSIQRRSEEQRVPQVERNAVEQHPNASRSPASRSNASRSPASRSNASRSPRAQAAVVTLNRQPPASHGRDNERNASPPVQQDITRIPWRKTRSNTIPQPPAYSPSDPFPIRRNEAMPTAPLYQRNELDIIGNNPYSNSSSMDSGPHLQQFTYQVYDNPGLKSRDPRLQNPSSDQVYDNPSPRPPVTRLRTPSPNHIGNRSSWAPVETLQNPSAIDYTPYQTNESIYDNPMVVRNNLQSHQNIGHSPPHINGRYDPSYGNNDRLDGISDNLQYEDDERTPLVSHGRRK